MRKGFPEDQYKILTYLNKGSKEYSINQLVDTLKIDQVFISASVQTLATIGIVKIREEEYKEYKIGSIGEIYAKEGFPDRKIIKGLNDIGRPCSIKDLTENLSFPQDLAGTSLRYLIDKSWIEIQGKGILKLTDVGKMAIEDEKFVSPNKMAEDEKFVSLLNRYERFLTEEEIKGHGIDLDLALRLLGKRRDIYIEKCRTIRWVSLTREGKELMKSGISLLREVTALTKELLIDGGWKEVQLKRYDITIDTVKAHPGKQHPFQRILQNTRKVFLEMGFTEIVSPHVESAFWDFDALFQPQDHPAREMQDTLYVSRPKEARLPDQSLVKVIKRVHEDGGETGSIGWQYKWDQEKAKGVVLRTHTTAATVRAVARLKRGPEKVFTVGRVFRRETVDYTHLPVFYQVDGIIIEKNASFANLLGILWAFYKKMGFKTFEFRPAFFPYTEPSVEVFVYLENKKRWIEMGGAGIFRPEVTLPLGCNDTVLAWGLGLERLAMFKYDLDHIKKIYLSDIKWLQEVPLCQ
ncbi:MAG: phenylalanine--tRNA ligase subunit alpha [Nitrospinae bacterium]|nr:phenylalanine--tRNA ligase subunit alpha [Nitrospinota bacterium]